MASLNVSELYMISLTNYILPLPEIMFLFLVKIRNPSRTDLARLNLACNVPTQKKILFLSRQGWKHILVFKYCQLMHNTALIFQVLTTLFFEEKKLFFQSYELNFTKKTPFFSITFTIYTWFETIGGNSNNKRLVFSSCDGICSLYFFSNLWGMNYKSKFSTLVRYLSMKVSHVTTEGSYRLIA